MQMTGNEIILKLEAAYRLIERERMNDVPILNHQLDVQGIDFKRHPDGWIGVMITPWFMNLMLVPSESKDPAFWCRQAGDKVSIAFPAGKFEFIYGEDDLVGEHFMCSLYSPMFVFKDQETAALTAKGVMEMLYNASEPDALDVEKQNHDRMEKIWAEPEETTEEESQPEPLEAAEEDTPEKPDMSRRSFMGLSKKKTDTPEGTRP